MPTNAIIVVEGPHDVEVVARLLQPEFSRARFRSEVPLRWQRFIPTAPPNPNSLPIRISHPVFLKAEDDRAVMIRAATSDDQIVTKLMGDLKDLAGAIPTAVGVVVDADTHPAADRVKVINQQLERAKSPVTFPPTPGAIRESNGRRSGIFVVPDNASAGGIETLLLEGGVRNFKPLLDKAKAYVEGIADSDVPKRAWREFIKWNRSKAIVHAMGAVLKPGRPTQASIEDHDWLAGSDLIRTEAFRSFLKNLTAPAA